MAHAFHPYTNALARVCVFSLVAVPAGLGWAITAFNWSPYTTRVDVPINQVVPFSHRHHVAGLGLDCRYCHTSVETSSFANIPPIHTCMTCHSQIWKDSPMLEPIRESYRTGIPIRWNRVNDLPDFVYFDHSIHVNKGIGCTTCHGEIEDMPLTWRAEPLYMSWCLNCHRNPQDYIRPREAVFDTHWSPPKDQQAFGFALVRKYHVHSLTNCYTCHR